jgi:hypothetical protein
LVRVNQEGIYVRLIEYGLSQRKTTILYYTLAPASLLGARSCTRQLQTGTNRPTTLLQSQAALLNREHSFYCSYSFGTAALRLNSCDPLPPCRPAGAINCVWTTYLGNYHNCSTLCILHRYACLQMMAALKL